MTTPNRRSFFAAGASAATVTLAAPQIARAQITRKWRCVTSWNKNLPGPGVSAERLARRITEMSQGEITVEVFPAGAIVPAFGVLDAVASGAVEMGHTAAVFWAGKMPVAPLFSAVPFGMTPVQHVAWLQSGGHALWDELYASRNVKPLLGGNTGPSASGWFKKAVNSLADIKGLRIRATGLSGEVYAALGATAVAIPPGDTYAALERGVIDAVEFLAPMNDLPLGLHKVAEHMLVPGFNKPNGASELLIRLDLWRALPLHLRAIVETASQAEHDAGLADAELQNGKALRELVVLGAKLGTVPSDVLVAARVAANATMTRIGSTDALAGRIVASYRETQVGLSGWTGIADVGRYIKG
ncbi:MAG: TRAP transporter substrate-binding protein [Hyphomicrobiaceae bacterium]|nr:TRAP transporter substrate-binding protein [Hyphomicrobiaceae bacterium]